MKAYMISRNNPYFAVSKKDGTFEIKNIPTGVPLTFRVWQEKAGYLQEITLDGAALSGARRDYPGYLDRPADLYARAWSDLASDRSTSGDR